MDLPQNISHGDILKKLSIIRDELILKYNLGMIEYHHMPKFGDFEIHHVNKEGFSFNYKLSLCTRMTWEEFDKACASKV